MDQRPDSSSVKSADASKGDRDRGAEDGDGMGKERGQNGVKSGDGMAQGMGMEWHSEQGWIDAEIGYEMGPKWLQNGAENSV